MSNEAISIRIGWSGPFKLDGEQVPERDEFTNSSTARGIYQIYGSHPVYGPKVLLYIGKATGQTFWQRLSEHGLAEWTSDRENQEIYLGRMLVSGEDIPSDEEWTRRMSIAEGLLIYAHCPAFNSVNIQNPPTEVAGYRVLNYGSYAQLMEEVSGERWDPACVRELDKFDYFKCGE